MQSIKLPYSKVLFCQGQKFTSVSQILPLSQGQSGGRGQVKDEKFFHKSLKFGRNLTLP